MIERAYVERLPTRDAHDVESLALELSRRGIDVVRFTAKELARRRLALAPEALVAGTVTSVESALRALGRGVPSGESYPPELMPFLGRRAWASTLGAVERAFAEGDHLPVFVKPRDRAKRFTGFVATDAADFFRAGRCSRRTEVWCVEPVRFVSEHRVFVVEGRIVGARNYHGDAAIEPERAVIDTSLAAYTSSPEAYAIDFGVLDDGRTVLVEANDGYAIGAYGLEPGIYADLIVRRWCQLASG